MRRSLIALFVAAVAASAMMATQSSVVTGITPPPEGRPPMGPLRRTESRRWEVTLNLNLPSLSKNDESDESLIVPVALLDTWWQVDPRSFRVRALVDMVPFPPAAAGLTVTQNRHGDSHADIPLPRVIDARAQVDVSWTVESWSCELDEATAARGTWPAKWPEDVERWRSASPGVDSDDPALKATVARLFATLPEGTPPVFAAKELIRAGCRSLRNANHSEGSSTGAQRRGIPVWGSSAALQAQVGCEADVVCISLAYLRAGGFPARPVIGVVQGSSSAKSERRSDSLEMWAEVFIPDAGWVPFDPNEIRGGISAQTAVNVKWDGFGTDKHWNERVPITHELHLYRPSAADIGRTASFAALCRLKTKLDQPGKGPTDILVKTIVVGRGRGRN